MSNPYNQYRAATVETANPVELVLMLYQGVLRFTQRGIQAIERQATDDAHNAFVHAQEIIAELMGSLDLDQGGDIAQSLLGLYVYSLRQLVQSNIEKSIAPAAEVVRIFRELIPAWQAIAEGRNRELVAAGREEVLLGNSR